MSNSTAALQHLIDEAQRLPSTTPRDVMRFAIAGYLIGSMKHLPGQHDQSTHGRGGAGAGKVSRSKLDRSENEFRHYASDNDAEVNQTLGASHQEWEKGLSKNERGALQAYTTNEYHQMNGALRGGLDPDKPPPTPIKNKISNVDKVIAKAPGLPEDTMLYRGMSEKNIHEQVKAGKIKKGNTLTDRGLMSTSPQSKETEIFMDGDHPVLYKIKGEKGARGAYLGFKSINPANADEAEFLLPRNAKLIVTSAKMKGNVAQIELAYLAD